MIKKIDLNDDQLASSLVKLQRESYLVEASLMNFYGIPPLKDTVESIRICGETFYGHFLEDNTLVAAIAVEISDVDKTLDICRVVVHPDFFRRGIGRQMVRFVENLYKDAKKIIVATGSKNYPAVELYKRMGYVVIGEKEVAAGVNVTMFSKRI